MLALRISKANAEKARLLLSEQGLVDKEHKIIVSDDFVEIPLLKQPETSDLEVLSDLEGQVVELSSSIERECFWDPMKDIIQGLDLPEGQLNLIPKKWEMLGDVLVLKIDDSLTAHKNHIAETYAEVLEAKTVLRDVSGIGGEFREPNVELLFGDETEAIHLENGIRYELDVSKVMFSSGNVDERIRMATLSKHGETVVDMFAGIGYFTLPIAVHSRPQRIIAYEINPTAFHYLQKNIELNEVGDIVGPHLINCNEAEEGVADRVIMGFVGTTHEYLPKALRILKKDGIIHYHETCPNALLPGRPTERVTEAAKGEGKTAEILSLKKIKSYAPGVSHVVLDVAIS